MEFKILICVLYLVAYTQAKSTYSHQDVAKDLVKNFKVEDVEKVAEKLQNIIDKLKDVKHNHLDHSKEEFKKKSQNALDLLMKMPKECTQKKAKQVQQISMNGIKKFTSCQGFTDALHAAEDLLSEAETAGLQIAMDLAVIGSEINNCTLKSPFLVIPCLAGLMDTLPEQIQDVIQTTADYIEYAEEGLKLIVADILSCFSQANKETDDKMASLFEELKRCATSIH